jgi:telomere length regulation protein
MDELLTTIRTTGGSVNEQLFAKAAEVKEVQSVLRGPISSLDDSLEALRSKPDFEALGRLLRYLDPDTPGGSNSNINVPSPEAAKVVNVLVNSTIPDYWAILDRKNPQGKTRAHPNERAILLRCLSSVGGLGAILARLQTLIALSKEGKRKTGNSDTSQHVLDMLDIVKYLLKSTKFILKIWNGLKCRADARLKRIVIWKEFVSIMGGGKLLSTFAEAYDIVRASRKDIMQSYWIASGNKYCAWIGRSAARMVLDLQGDDQDAWKAIAQLLGKSLGLGYMG